MSENIISAVRLLGIYTAGRFDVYALAGPQRASCRAHIMSAIACRRVPQSKSGINAIRDALFSALAPAGDCLAVRERNFVAACRSIIQGT